MFDLVGFIARVCHEVNKAYCELQGDTSQVSWEQAPDNIKQSARDGVEAVRIGKVVKPEDSHNNWLEFKKADGWVYGTEKDAEKKTHPCIMPYNNLPIQQRRKDELFVTTAKNLLAGYNDRGRA